MVQPLCGSGRAERPRPSVSGRSCVSDGFRVDVTARPYRRPMAEPKPLSPCRAWWVRQLHRWDWTFYPAASAGDATVRVRRQVRPSVTPAIRRLQRVGTGRWEGRRPLDHTGRMVLANVSGVPVGYAYAVDHLSGSAGCSLLDDVVVDPSMRNRGIGHTLIAEMAAWMHEDGYTTIFGCATGGDGSAIHGGLFGWYERMGFEMTSPGGDMRADVPYLADRTSVFRAGENETHRP